MPLPGPPWRESLKNVDTAIPHATGYCAISLGIEKIHDTSYKPKNDSQVISTKGYLPESAREHSESN